MSDDLPDYESDKPISPVAEFKFPDEFFFRTELNFFFSMEGGAIDERLQRSDPKLCSLLAARQIRFLLNHYQRGDELGNKFPIKRGENLEVESHTNSWCVIVPPSEGPEPQALEDLREFAQSQDRRKLLASTGRIFEVILISPAFKFSDQELFKHQFGEIIHILEKIPASPTSIAEDALSYVHYAWTSEIHHFKFSITNEDNSPFDLLTLQNLIVIWSRYRNGIERLLPPHRRSVHINNQHKFNAPRPLLNEEITPRAVQRFRAMVYESTDAADLESVFSLHGPFSVPTKITFRDNCNEELQDNRNEIQFWEAAATFSMQEITFWMNFVISVFKFSYDLAGLNLMFDTIPEPNLIDDLLELVDISATALDFARTISLYNT